MGTITGGEARELYAQNPIVLLPMGSHEDQGPHAPMGDYLLAEKVAELAALRANELGVRTVAAPVLPFGGADYYGSMPGGIALSQATFRSAVADIVESLKRHGLTRIIIFNGHSGNVEPIAEVTRHLYRSNRILIPTIYLWLVASGLVPKIVGAENAARACGHGADPLTSIGLHLFPDLMRPDLVPHARPLKRDPVLDLPFTANGAASFEGSEISMPNEYDDVYWDGVGKGDPTLCSAKTGAALTKQLTDYCARFIQHFASKTSG